MHFTFLRRDEAAGHHHALGAQRQSGGHGPAVRDAANGDHGNFYRSRNLGCQHHGGDIVIQRVTAFFDAGGIDSVKADFFRMQGMAQSADLMKHFHAGFLEHLDGLHSGHLVQRRAGKLDARHFFLGANFNIHLVVLRRDPDRGQQRDGHKEGFIGEPARFPDRRAKFVRRFIIARRQIADAAGIGHRRAHFWFAKPHHGPADNGILDSEHPGDLRVEHEIPPIFFRCFRSFAFWPPSGCSEYSAPPASGKDAEECSPGRNFRPASVRR